MFSQCESFNSVRGFFPPDTQTEVFFFLFESQTSADCCTVPQTGGGNDGDRDDNDGIGGELYWW